MASARLWSVMAMYLETGVARRPRHGPGVGAAVGRRRVHVHVAAQVLERDQAWERARLGGLDFAAILAQFRRNVRQSERLVDALFRLAGHDRSHLRRDRARIR